MTGTIGLLTSGGDAPGMNAAVRSVVRMATAHRVGVLGFVRGYHGLVHDDAIPLGPRSVSNIIQRGGTILKTARSDEFRTHEGRQRAKANLEKHEVTGLIVIGGDGSLCGARELGKIWNGRLVGAPGTIDNDMNGTDETIGFDTALNTAVEAIDRIRDTADSFERVFLVEVMGRQAGFIALGVGTAGGAEEILVPEAPIDLEDCCHRLLAAKEAGKVMSILVVAEGGAHGGAYAVGETIKARTGFDPRITVLGHIQRGGRPTARDRILATKLGAFAVDTIVRGESGVMVGEIDSRLVTTPFQELSAKHKPLDPYLLKLIHVLAR